MKRKNTWSAAEKQAINLLNSIEMSSLITTLDNNDNNHNANDFREAIHTHIPSNSLLNIISINKNGNIHLHAEYINKIIKKNGRVNLRNPRNTLCKK